MIKAQSAPAMPIRYGLRAMGSADLPVVRGGFKAPHVTRCWPNPKVALRAITHECFILPMDGCEAGHLQVYGPDHGPPPAADGQTSGHPYRDQPRGNNLVIGVARFIGRGHGSRLIRCTVEHPFEGKIFCVATNPDPANARKVAAFLRVDIRCVGERDTSWGHVLLMRCDNLKPSISP